MKPDKDPTFVLDLRNVQEPGEGSVSPSTEEGDGFSVARHLEALLAPYSDSSAEKARELLVLDTVNEDVKKGNDTQARVFHVQGSRPYVVRITRGDDFLYAECSCPNGQHRGGDAICYHSIAARVIEAGLAPEWLSEEG